MNSGHFGPSLYDYLTIGFLVLFTVAALIGSTFCLVRQKWIGLGVCVALSLPGIIIFIRHRIKESRISAASQIYYDREKAFSGLSLFAAQYLREHPAEVPTTTGFSEVVIRGLRDAVAASYLKSLKIRVVGDDIVDPFGEKYRFFWCADERIDYVPGLSRSVDDRNGFEPRLVITDSMKQWHCWNVSRSDLSRVRPTKNQPNQRPEGTSGKSPSSNSGQVPGAPHP